MFKVFHNRLPFFLQDMFSFVNSDRTRQQNSLVVPRCTLKIVKCSIRCKGVFIYNKYKNVIDFTCAYSTFKQKVKSVIF